MPEAKSRRAAMRDFLTKLLVAILNHPKVL